MKILKHGELKERKFTCKKCGCEFIADMSEYCFGITDDYMVDCPDCNQLGCYYKSEAPLCIEAIQGNPALNVTTPPISHR